MTEPSTVGEPLIRTPDQRLRVFVSSTLGELAPERAAVRAAIEALQLIPVLFELGARPHPPRALYRAYLAQSHVFLGIYWQRYGWVAPGEDVSGLEDEYRLAGELPRLLYLKEPSDEREPRLRELVARFSADDRASYRTFRTPEELAELVATDLVVLLTERFEAGASRGRADAADAIGSPPPVPVTRTLGRDREVAEILGHLADGARLVTLTGPGGTGKSRLALEVARREPLAGRVHFVPLEPLTDAAGFLRTVADRVGGIGAANGPLVPALAHHLDGRASVLLIDNFEHVSAAAPDLAALLDAAPSVQVLVTSRAPLRLRGEREYPVAPLPVPVAGASVGGSPAEQLFVERARAVRPAVTASADDAAVIAELVRRLDGLPLAIELAAARTRLLPPASLLERLQERLDVLSGGAVDLPPRHRTLRTTIEWSYTLLDPVEQRLFERLSVFASGASLDAAVTVGAEPGTDVVEVLSSLLEKSLVLTTAGVGGDPRVQMLHTIRTYARERLHDRDGSGEIADRHAAWYLQRVSLVDPFRASRPLQHLDALLADVEDVLAAMHHVLERRDLDRVAGFARSTWLWLWLSGRIADVAPWFEAAGALAAEDDLDLESRAAVLYGLGQVRALVGDARRAADAMEPALALLEEFGDDARVAGGLICLAAIAPARQREHEVVAHSTRALEIGERLGIDEVVAWAAANLGTALTVAGDLPAARREQQRSLSAARRSGFAPLQAQALGQLAMVDVLDGRLEPAWRQLLEAADLLGASTSLEWLSYWLEFAALACAADADARRALEAFAAAEAAREQLRLPIWPHLAPLHDAAVAQARAEVGTDAVVLEAAARQDPRAAMDRLVAARRSRS